MKNTIRTLMMTTAIICIAGAAQADNVRKIRTDVNTYTIVESEMDATTRATHVRNLQQALQARGYNPGTVDGVMGNQTTAALRNFQRDNNMEVTGVATQETFDHLGMPGALIVNAERTEVQEREIIRFPLAFRGSENANVYDDPSANRGNMPVFTQRFKTLREPATIDYSTSYNGTQTNR